ncbi:hypothetical protein HAX54_010954, partial [Datura stramonium]|nr:hypothetical protein [Datura stramonium]
LSKLRMPVAVAFDFKTPIRHKLSFFPLFSIYLSNNLSSCASFTLVLSDRKTVKDSAGTIASSMSVT